MPQLPRPNRILAVKASVDYSVSIAFRVGWIPGLLCLMVFLGMTTRTPDLMPLIFFVIVIMLFSLMSSILLGAACGAIYGVIAFRIGWKIPASASAALAPTKRRQENERRSQLKQDQQVSDFLDSFRDESKQ